MKYERISINQVNINISSTMSRMNDLCKNLHVDSWEFYNFLVSGYPSIELQNPSFHNKAMEGEQVDKSETKTYDFGFNFDWDIPQCDFKISTKRYDIRDKAHHGSKGKKINDYDGEKWTRIHMVNPKKKKAMKKQNIQDIQDMEFSQMCSSCDIKELARMFYRMVDKPATKTYHEVLMEVFDKFDFMLTDTCVWDIIEDVVKKEYEDTQWDIITATMKLENAFWDLEAAERRANYYQDMLNKLLG